MNPVINCEEFIGKTVGRRRKPANAMDYADGLQRCMAQFTRPYVKPGVYRFNSHEEADQWLMDHTIRKLGS